MPGLEGEHQQIAALGSLVAVASRRVAEGGCVVGLWDAPAGREARPVALFRLHGARRARVRAERGLFVACDDAGRVISYDVEAGALAHNVRL
ncbi:MAG: hypothetical protein MUF34_13095 [Polyangiaceae bacterium]|nr:hypothetical protein [Polyangiaceae bacterium]